MTRLLTLLCISTMALALAGCPSEENNETNNLVSDVTPDTTTEDSTADVAADTKADGGDDCVTTIDYYNAEIVPVFQSTCSGCHYAGGTGSGSMLLIDGELDGAATRAVVREKVENVNGDNISIFIGKPTAVIGHGGGEQFAPDSDEAKKFQAFIDRIETPVACDTGNSF